MRRQLTHQLRRRLRELLGITAGVGTGLLLLPVVPLAWLARAATRARGPGLDPPLTPLLDRLTRLERARLTRLLRVEVADRYPRDRALPYLSCRLGLAALGALVLASLLVSVLYGSLLVWAWLVFSPVATVPSGIGGAFLLFLTVHGITGLRGLEARLAHHFLGPSEPEILRRRITELANSRAGVMEAITEERRRIERDLHDGVQQRLVALGLSISRAQRSPERADELLAQARQEAGAALAELREVAWRIYPTVLDEAGLAAALETVAERCPLPVELTCRLAGEPPRPVATVAYFVVCEAVTNAVKHADASTVAVHVAAGRDRLTVTVTDDGVGGADPAGGGLLGLSRRAAALDGRLHLHSPPGGPTVITAELPCA
ncbi:sensor histidine kinase [Streptomyces sp. DSM 44915]|uniref:histidine kinase n=1 Tax=Streptomyces chisholmiae TaxID=3075540 RepID=A0ABU2JLT9_9ACTN|nr:sensor histidine kinase [Streptomyces sp. DSM 44915]MDT0265689.1 sensor histidine kinase [Streptomyces sp. DSM 44915]